MAFRYLGVDKKDGMSLLEYINHYLEIQSQHRLFRGALGAQDKTQVMRSMFLG